MALENVQLDTITTNVWRNFYDTLKVGVTTVSIPGTSAITVQNYVNSYTDKMLNDKENYPMLIINSPTFSFENITFTTPEVTGRIEVEIIANQALSADKFLDLMQKTIRDAETTLSTYGIDEIIIDDTANTFYERGAIKLHSRKVVWRFKFSP